MKEARIDLLNVFLILLSLLGAFLLPFELFLFSYAVLGPLHYLTEINWLNDKNYFIQNKKGAWIFLALALLLSVPVVLQLPILSTLTGTSTFQESYDYNTLWVLLALLSAVGLVYFNTKKHALLYLTVSFTVVGGLYLLLPYHLMLFAFFIPTILHVYLFTLLFMIYGWKKHRTHAGTANIALMILCPVIIFSLNPDPAGYRLTEQAEAALWAGDFQHLNEHIGRLLPGYDELNFSLLSSIGIKAQIFIAFCYTYHYLNWFSKTSVIGWGNLLSRKRSAGIILIWLGSVSLYLYDYKTGFCASFFLSILHVMLEFPLNITSLKDIWGETRTGASG